MFYIVLLCIALSVNAEETVQQKCANMLNSFKYLCPGQVKVIDPKVEQLEKGK